MAGRLFRRVQCSSAKITETTDETALQAVGMMTGSSVLGLEPGPPTARPILPLAFDSVRPSISPTCDPSTLTTKYSPGQGMPKSSPMNSAKLPETVSHPPRFPPPAHLQPLHSRGQGNARILSSILINSTPLQRLMPGSEPSTTAPASILGKRPIRDVDGTCSTSFPPSHVDAHQRRYTQAVSSFPLPHDKPRPLSAGSTSAANNNHPQASQTSSPSSLTSSVLPMSLSPFLINGPGYTPKPAHPKTPHTFETFKPSPHHDYFAFKAPHPSSNAVSMAKDPFNQQFSHLTHDVTVFRATINCPRSFAAPPTARPTGSFVYERQIPRLRSQTDAMAVVFGARELTGQENNLMQHIAEEQRRLIVERRRIGRPAGSQLKSGVATRKRRRSVIEDDDDKEVEEEDVKPKKRRSTKKGV